MVTRLRFVSIAIALSVRVWLLCSNIYIVGVATSVCVTSAASVSSVRLL